MIQGTKTLSRKISLRFSSVLFSLSVSLVTCEVFLRTVNYRPLLSDRQMYVTNGSEIVPYKLRPNYKNYYLGKPVKIDRDGYRIVQPKSSSLELSREKSPAKTILLVGDSVVFGHGVRDEETMGSQLQDALWASGLNYRVKNIGVPGYTSWNEYGALVEYFKKFSAVLVIVVHVPNDVSLDNDQLGIGKGKYLVLSDSWIHRLTQFLYGRVYTVYLIREAVRRAVVSATASGRKAREEYLSDASMDYSVAALEKIRDLCGERNVKFSVAIYRDIVNHSDPGTSAWYEGKIKGKVEERGIRAFILRSHITALTVKEARVFWNDPHPSPKAINLIVGDLLAEVKRRLPEM